MSRTPVFLVIEGIDGSGTTTQCDLLCRHLRSQGHPVVQTREPGGTPAGERIREIVLDSSLVGLDELTELLLCGASRRQHVRDVIRPSLAAGKPVISDRYTPSSIAYQGAGRGLGRQIVDTVNDLATGGLAPDFTVFLDLPVEEALRRRQTRHRGVEDRIEQQGRRFQELVRGAYRELAQADLDAAQLLDATPEPARLARQILSALGRRFPAFPFK